MEENSARDKLNLKDDAGRAVATSNNKKSSAASTAKHSGHRTDKGGAKGAEASASSRPTANTTAAAATAHSGEGSAAAATTAVTVAEEGQTLPLSIWSGREEEEEALSSFTLWVWKFVCWLLACLTSQQHACVFQGRICSDKFTCCHTVVEVADQTFYLTQSQYADTGPTSPALTL